LCNYFKNIEWSGVLFYEGDQKTQVTLKDILPLDVGDSISTFYNLDERLDEYLAKNTELYDCHIGHIHSHHKMDTTFSGVDLEELEENSANHNFYLSVIANNALEYNALIASRVKSNHYGTDGVGENYLLATNESLYLQKCKISLSLDVEKDFVAQIEKLLKNKEEEEKRENELFKQKNKMETRNNRFQDALWYGQQEKVLIAGAGGIGSWTALLLSRAGLDVTVFDFDRIEEHNLGGQFFRNSDIGELKVEALHSIVKSFCDKQISIFDQKVQGVYSPFTVSAMDNMEGRKTLFEAWLAKAENSLVTPLFIDGRLSFEQLQIFCVTPKEANRYREYLFDDDEVEDEPCTMKQTSHMASMIASHISAFMLNHLVNIYEKRVVRSVPFIFEYFSPLNLTNHG